MGAGTCALLAWLLALLGTAGGMRAHKDMGHPLVSLGIVFSLVDIWRTQKLHFSALFFFPHSKYSRKHNKINEIIFATSWCSLKDQWVLLLLNSSV